MDVRGYSIEGRLAQLNNVLGRLDTPGSGSSTGNTSVTNVTLEGEPLILGVYGGEDRSGPSCGWPNAGAM